MSSLRISHFSSLLVPGSCQWKMDGLSAPGAALKLKTPMSSKSRKSVHPCVRINFTAARRCFL